MNKYILIQNDGAIESNSFELIGASTKRGETGKIGFFGSGLKYSIAYMMRNGIGFKVFSGETEMIFSIKNEILKGQPFERICINGIQTSYTTTMGPTWTEDWFVLREIYCNALDESNCIIVKEIETVSASAGKTRIYIELTESLREVINDWDKYFSDERTPIFLVPKVYTSSLGSEDGSAAAFNYQGITVFPKTKGVIYRRGIKVADKPDMLYDYEFQYININEDRTAKNISAIDYAFCDMLGQMANEEWVKAVLRSAMDDKRTSEYGAISWNHPDQPPSEKWITFSENNLLVVKEISGRFADEISTSRKEVFLLTSSFARDLKKKLPAIKILGMGNVIGDNFFSEVEKTPKMDFLLKDVLNSLKEMNYEVPFDISVAEFDDENIMGHADIANKHIHIAKKTFDMGRREIAMTLLEETEHIKSGKGDETRAFQTHIFSQWLKTMEDSNGLFL